MNMQVAQPKSSSNQTELNRADQTEFILTMAFLFDLDQPSQEDAKATKTASSTNQDAPVADSASALSNASFDPSTTQVNFSSVNMLLLRPILL
ncbi:hypothetical protein C7B76_06825 [filamentous cyanobacterium CCP2]|nr:hypothetical protein C7B76_06825 [filamentous cyanobacterium CCP2]